MRLVRVEQSLGVCQSMNNDRQLSVHILGNDAGKEKARRAVSRHSAAGADVTAKRRSPYREKIISPRVPTLMPK